MGILLCEQNFLDVWRRNKSVRAEIGQILRTHHTHAAKLVVEIIYKECWLGGFVVTNATASQHTFHVVAYFGSIL